MSHQNNIRNNYNVYWLAYHGLNSTKLDQGVLQWLYPCLWQKPGDQHFDGKWCHDAPSHVTSDMFNIAFAPSTAWIYCRGGHWEWALHLLDDARPVLLSTLEAEQNEFLAPPLREFAENIGNVKCQKISLCWIDHDFHAVSCKIVHADAAEAELCCSGRDCIQLLWLKRLKPKIYLLRKLDKNKQTFQQYSIIDLYDHIWVICSNIFRYRSSLYFMMLSDSRLSSNEVRRLMRAKWALSGTRHDQADLL